MNRERNIIRGIVVAFAAVLIAVHLRPGSAWKLHRDKYRFLAMANHLDWGYWSTPPFMGLLSWLISAVSDLSFRAVVWSRPSLGPESWCCG
jgi:hypothetical protein